MTDEKGYTLIEILAALTLSITVFGVASMAFFAVYHLWNNSSQEYADDAKIALTIDTLSHYLSDCTEIYLASPDEVRIKTGVGPQAYNYKAIRLLNGVLTIYDLNGVDDDNFTSGLSSGNYINPEELADNVADMKIRYNGLDISSGDHFRNGEKLTFLFTFNVTRFAVDGSKEVTAKTIEKQIKLLPY